MNEDPSQENIGESHMQYDQATLESFNALALKYFGASKISKVRLIGTYVAEQDGRCGRLIHLRMLKGKTSILPDEIDCLNGRHRWFQNVSETIRDTQGQFLQNMEIYKFSIASMFITLKGQLKVGVKRISKITSKIPQEYWTSEIPINFISEKTEALLAHRGEQFSKLEYQHLVEAYNQQSLIPGVIIRSAKGGFTVEIEGIECFLPGSQTFYDNRTYVPDTKIPVLCILLKENTNGSWVVSEKQAVKLKSLLTWQGNEPKEGEIYCGEIADIVDYGYFIDIGGLTILAHKNDRTSNKTYTERDSVRIKVIKATVVDEVYRGSAIIIEA